MKYLRQLATATMLVLMISIVHQGCDSAENKKFETNIAKLKSFQFGDSRVALSEIEILVALTTNEEEKKTRASRLAEMLDSDVSFAAKQFVCQQLRVIGNEEQIPALAKLLLDDKYTDIAVFALEDIPSPKVDEVFRNSVNELNGKAKIGVINALGERRDRESVKILSPLLTDSNNDIAESAALSMEKIGTVEAGYELKNIMDNVSGKWREKLANHYLMCASNLVANGDIESALKIYNEMSTQTENKRLIMLAQAGLVSTGQLEADVFVLKAIKDEDPIIRRLAIRTVIQTPGEDATMKFCAILPDLPEASQGLLIQALSDRGDPRALETVLRVLSQKNTAIRIPALKAIASLGDETVVPILMHTIIMADERGSEAARNSLYRLKGNQVDKKILQMTGDNNVTIRKEAIIALSVRNYVNAKPTLLDMLNDPNVEIRVVCWNALGELGSGSDLAPMISSWTKTISSTELQIAEDNVVKVFRKLTIQERATSDILVAINTQNNKEVKISLISGLGRIGDENALPQLRELLENEDPEIRTATIRALSSWPSEEPLQDLRRVITTTEDEKQKVIALRGYIHLIGLETTRENVETVDLYGDALNMAWRPEERKLALAGYAEVPSIAALNALEGYLVNEELKNEATAAALNICEEMIEENSDIKEQEKISDVLKKIVQNSDVESMRDKATNMLKKLEE
jgi:HEAT repeat protein